MKAGIRLASYMKNRSYRTKHS